MKVTTNTTSFLRHLVFMLVLFTCIVNQAPAQAKSFLADFGAFEFFADKDGDEVSHFIDKHPSLRSLENVLFASPASLAPIPPGALCEDMSFQASLSFTVGQKPQSIAAADFNNDGAPDLVAANASDVGYAPLLLNYIFPFGTYSKAKQLNHKMVFYAFLWLTA